MHNTSTHLMTWTTNDGGEDCTGSIISGEPGLAHTGTIVNNEGLYFFVSHVLGVYCADVGENLTFV